MWVLFSLSLSLHKIMATSLSFLFLISCFYVLALSTDAARNDADRLWELITSRGSVGSTRLSHDNWWSYKKPFSSVYVGKQDGLMEADKIDVLPGQPDGAEFDQYAGYVTVDPSAGRALFYYFVESPQDSSTKPLVLWLNGGPGCSSIGGGAMVELGPFRVNSDGKTLQANDYAWNKVANVIFLESPAGVGFSYSNTTSDYKLSGDNRTAADSYTFLINWLEKFPQYKTRDFYITGESYAGHYIPELASVILANNNITNRTVINLKGIVMGNAYIDGNVNTKATYEYYWTHALISDEALDAIQSKCNFSIGDYTQKCINALRSADAMIGHIDPYDIYAPLCNGQDSRAASNNNTRQLLEEDPCSGSYAYSYLNLPEVQKALHANTTGLSYPWTACSNFVGRDWTDELTTTLPIVEDLINNGIRVWIISGDQDAVVPVTSTRYSMDMLALPIEASWQPWYADGEVAGYVVAYKGLYFATVRGAGHMVPSFQPERAFTLISSFLEGKSPPSG